MYFAKKNLSIIILLLLIFLAIAGTIFLKIEIGIIIISLSLLIPLIIIDFKYPLFGFLLTFILASIVFLIKRFIDIPSGAIVEFQFFFILIGIFSNSIYRNHLNKKIKTFLSILIIIWIIYQFFQFLNPYSHSILAWLFSLRNIFSFLSLYIIGATLFKEYKALRYLFITWFVIALVASLYALFQEFFGLPDFDYNWVTSDERRTELHYIQGRWRKWSFLSDSSSFGMFMSFSFIVFAIIGIESKNWKTKLVIFPVITLMLLSLSFSGTRTAYAMIPLGILFYIILTIHKKNTLIIALLSFLSFFIILYIPINNKILIRIRSTFSPSTDASMNVREINRAKIQPYIYSHPIGGGVNMTGPDGEIFAPHHRLAGFPPDSYYVKIALELGFIGLFIIMLIFITAMINAVSNYYNVEMKNKKFIFAALSSGFFAITIAGYTQESIDQLPYGLVLYASIAIMSNKIK